MILTAMLDSFLKEMPWIPAYAKPAAFFALAPLITIGSFLLVPYMRDRMAILTTKLTSNFLIALAVVITGLQAILWAFMYYEAEVVGTATIRPAALALKDVILVSSAVVFGLLAIRLLKWFRLTRNKVVLSLGVQAAGSAPFAVLHLFPDFLPSPTPRIILDGIASSLVILILSMTLTMTSMSKVYYGQGWMKRMAPVLLAVALTTVFLVSSRLGVVWDVATLSILLFAFIIASPLQALNWFRLVPALPNATAKEYYRGMSYGLGLYMVATCSVGLRLAPVFPLSGFAGVSMMLPAACLSFATFTSSAAYFSITEDVRKQIRQATSFVASIGEAESTILTEQQVARFYDRLTGLARASGAVEEAAISKDEIYSYASALKRLQVPRTVKAE